MGRKKERKKEKNCSQWIVGISNNKIHTKNSFKRDSCVLGELAYQEHLCFEKEKAVPSELVHTKNCCC